MTDFDTAYWDSLYAADPGDDVFYEPDPRESSSQSSRSSSQSSRSDEGETPSQKDTARNARNARINSGPSQDDKKTDSWGCPVGDATYDFGSDRDDDKHNEPPQDGKQSAADKLVALAHERYRFGWSSDAGVFGVPLGGGHVVRPLRGGHTSLRAELATAYRRMHGKVAPQQALADAMLVLEGEAQEGEPQDIHLRIAEHAGSIWIDLGDAGEQVIRIDRGSWEVVNTAPVLFRRTALTGALPTPERGESDGGLDELWKLLNVAVEDRPLVVGWLVATLGAPGVPHPILGLDGEQGTGKSSATKLLVDLVDPSPVPLRKPPKDMDGWVTAAAGSWVVGVDNLSSVPDWLSDTLCRAVTGDGDVRRVLYTDANLAVFAFRRCIIMNGIDLGGLRGDLAERMLAVRLDTIPGTSRMTERELSAAWLSSHPRILASLLDCIASVRASLLSVRLAKSPRMADFAEILAALDNGALDRYLNQSTTMAADSLEADQFIAAMLQAIDKDGFEGTAAELRALVTPQDERPPRGWPSARGVTTVLKRNAPALRSIGWSVINLGATNHANVTRWRLSRPEMSGKPSSQSSQSSQGSGLDPETLDSDGLCRLHHDQPEPDCYTCKLLTNDNDAA